MLSKQILAQEKFLDQPDKNLNAFQKEILQYLLLLSPSYPDIKLWYTTKVIPGLNSGERYVVSYSVSGKIIALGIAKNTPEEKKICTIRVSPEYQNHGIGATMFHNLLEWLDTETPIITVDEEKVPAFKRLFCYYGFHLNSTVKGLYLPDKVEYIFN